MTAHSTVVASMARAGASRVSVRLTAPRLIVPMPARITDSVKMQSVGVILVMPVMIAHNESALTTVHTTVCVRISLAVATPATLGSTVDS
jgi:hypothetical protein